MTSIPSQREKNLSPHMPTTNTTVGNTVKTRSINISSNMELKRQVQRLLENSNYATTQEQQHSAFSLKHQFNSTGGGGRSVNGRNAVIK